MSPEFVRKTVARRPFRPFVLHLAGARSIPVRSPEFIQVPNDGRLIVVQHPTGSAHVVDLLLVTDIEFPETSILDGGGGQ